MGGRGDMRSAQETVDWWLLANKVEMQKVQRVTLPDTKHNEISWSAQKSGAPVVFYRAEGAGHLLPTLNCEQAMGFVIRCMDGSVCQDVEGAELAWDFMKIFGTQK